MSNSPSVYYEDNSPSRDELREMARNVVRMQRRLPSDIEHQATRLEQIYEDVSAFKKTADGLLFGKIGIDGFIGLLPGIGGIYTFGAGAWLTTLAVRAKCSVGTILACCFLTLMDFIIGVVAGVGDILDFFFRSHAWMGKKIMRDIENKLDRLDDVRDLQMRGLVEEQAAGEHESLRDLLLRNGATEQRQMIKWAIPVGGFLLLLAMCS